MRTLFVILILFITTLPNSFARESENSSGNRFNFGVTISANAPFVHDRKMYVNQVEVNKPENETKIAGSISPTLKRSSLMPPIMLQAIARNMGPPTALISFMTSGVSMGSAAPASNVTEA